MDVLDVSLFFLFPPKHNRHSSSRRLLFFLYTQNNIHLYCPCNTLQCRRERLLTELPLPLLPLNLSTRNPLLIPNDHASFLPPQSLSTSPSTWPHYPHSTMSASTSTSTFPWWTKPSSILSSSMTPTFLLPQVPHSLNYRKRPINSS